MKKLLLSAVCALSVFAASAQDWYVGPQASLNLTGLTHPSEYSTSTKVGYAFGAFGGYEFNKLIGIEAQINYSSQGQKVSYMYDGGTGFDGTVKLNYITVPIMAKFHVVKGLNLMVGPQFGFNTRAKAKGDYYNELEDPVNKNVDIKDNVRGFDFGFIVGAAYQFDFGLRAGISYYGGMVNATKSDMASKNKVFAITVGWKF